MAAVDSLSFSEFINTRNTASEYSLPFGSFFENVMDTVAPPGELGRLIVGLWIVLLKCKIDSRL